jgi:hypothetical protein
VTERYAARAEALAREIRDREAAGLALVVTAAGEAEAVVTAIAGHFPPATAAPADADAVDRLDGIAFVAGLPGDDVLRRLNDRRDTLISRRALVVLALSADDLPHLERVAGDTYSTVAFTTTVPFEPAPDVDEASAREELHRAYAERLGRLDLRGFIRQEREDAAWRIEDLYQETRAERLPGMEPEPLAAALARRPYDRPVVVLGHPGSGKTFFLRWCALRGAAADALLGVERPLPVLVPLAAYAAAAGGRSLAEYALDGLLRTAPLAAHAFARAFSERRVVFLLDGLDEVGTDVGRRRCAEAIASLTAAYAGGPIVVTCRVAGWAESALPEAHVFTLRPLDEAQIRAFLTAWCGLYAVETGGRRDEGEQRGGELASEVLANPSLRQLAESPLLLTVLAVVQRAGLRLPDHRVELYEHAITVLVERWNQVRSLAGPGGAVPIRAVDALRLLGPVALELVRRGERASIDRESLRAHIAAVLARGHVRGLTDADEVIDVFRRSIGLLVEQAPDRFGFLHLTFVEAFAARELVRSGELEALVADPDRVFREEWREVVLLAAGELGLLRADDRRLDALVGRIVFSAHSDAARNMGSVPSLLTGLLADDPGLSDASADALVTEVLEHWWLRPWDDHMRIGWSWVLEAFKFAERSGHDRNLLRIQRRLGEAIAAEQDLPGGSLLAMWRLLANGNVEPFRKFHVIFDRGLRPSEWTPWFDVVEERIMATSTAVEVLQLAGFPAIEVYGRACAGTMEDRRAGKRLLDVVTLPSVEAGVIIGPVGVCTIAPGIEVTLIRPVRNAERPPHARNRPADAPLTLPPEA